MSDGGILGMIKGIGKKAEKIELTEEQETELKKIKQDAYFEKMKEIEKKKGLKLAHEKEVKDE